VQPGRKTSVGSPAIIAAAPEFDRMDFLVGTGWPFRLAGLAKPGPRIVAIAFACYCSYLLRDRPT